MAHPRETLSRHSKKPPRRVENSVSTQAPPAGVLTALPAEPITRIAAPSVEGIQWSTIELGPELPMPVFTSMEVWNPERIGALAIYCSDGRWGDAFDEFCHTRL